MLQMKAISKKNIALLLVFLVFITLRIFANPSIAFIGGDNAKYLSLARNFPYHTLDNHQLFLLHGPAYPYALHFLSYFFEDHNAGLLLSFASSIVTFFALYKLLMLLTKNYNLAIATLLLFSLSVENVQFAHYIQKEAFMLMLFTLSIYFYVKGLLINKKCMYYSMFLGAIAALTTDHAIFLIMVFALAYFFFRNKKIQLKHSIAPIIAAIIFYSLFLSARLYIYSTNEYYPAGVDGVVEKVSDFGIKQIISPAYFPETMEINFFKSSLVIHMLFIFAYMFNLEPLKVPVALDRLSIGTLFSGNLTAIFTIIKFAFYLVLFSLFIYGIYITLKSLKGRKIHNNHNLFFLLVFLIFLFPITQRVTTIRMVLMSTIFLYYFISLGFVNLRLDKRLFRHIPIVFGLLFLYLIFYASANSFLLGFDKSFEAKNTADFLNMLPKDGVMSQVGYSPELNYQTNKRIVSMPSDPLSMDRIIRDFDINYVLYGERYWAKPAEGNNGRVFNYEVIGYVRQNPQKFKLLKVIKEEYKDINSQDQIYVYEVV